MPCGLKLAASIGLGVRPCGASYFFLLRQEKVSKKKATLGRCRLRRFPALLEMPGGCGTRATPSNSPRRRPPAFLRCSAPLKGPGETTRGETGVPSFAPRRGAGKVVDARPR